MIACAHELYSPAECDKLSLNIILTHQSEYSTYQKPGPIRKNLIPLSIETEALGNEFYILKFPIILTAAPMTVNFICFRIREKK